MSTTLSLDHSNLGLSVYLFENGVVSQLYVEGTGIDFRAELC